MPTLAAVWGGFVSKIRAGSQAAAAFTGAGWFLPTHPAAEFDPVASDESGCGRDRPQAGGCRHTGALDSSRAGLQEKVDRSDFSRMLWGRKITGW
jgi:hypothetical protein